MIDDSLTYSTSVLPFTSILENAPESAWKAHPVVSNNSTTFPAVQYPSISLEVEKLMSKGYTRDQAIAIVQNRAINLIQPTNKVSRT